MVNLPGTRAAVCRGCGAPILWITTPGGKSMPCDPKPVVYWRRRGAPEKIVTQNGEVVSADLNGMPGLETGVGYVSHFATCPRARDFQRR